MGFPSSSVVKPLVAESQRCKKGLQKIHLEASTNYMSFLSINMKESRA